MDITRWSIPVDYILCSQRWRSSIQSAKTRLGADCGSEHKLLIGKFRLKLKKVGKTTRPFTYEKKERKKERKKEKVAQSCLTLCDPMDCLPFLGKNTGGGCHFLLQEIFPTQGLNLGLLHCRQMLYHLSHADLNKIPYDNTVEVTNRFKGLDLIECLKNYRQRFMTLYRRQ